MENGQVFATYLTKEVWDDLVLRGWAGPPRDPALHWIRNPPGVMSPTRPVWLGPDQLVYRDQLFRRFKGFLNYGSPYLRPQFADLVADWLVTGGASRRCRSGTNGGMMRGQVRTAGVSPGAGPNGCLPFGSWRLWHHDGGGAP
jgi:hypothetical protein